MCTVVSARFAPGYQVFRSGVLMYDGLDRLIGELLHDEGCQNRNNNEHDHSGGCF
jgi:hypothetical protein